MNNIENFDGTLQGAEAMKGDGDAAERGERTAETIEQLALHRDALIKQLEQAEEFLATVRDIEGGDATKKNLQEVLGRTRQEIAKFEQLINDVFFEDAIRTGREIDAQQRQEASREE